MSNNQSPANAPRPPQRHTPSLFWPIVLIVSGILLLLSNLGYLPEPSWNLLWRLWPVILIALGLDVLIGRRSVAGAIISGVLIFVLIGGVILAVFFARNIPLLADLARRPKIEHESISHPLDDIDTASVNIDFSSLRGRLTSLDDSPNLIEGEIDYHGSLIFDVTTDDERVMVDLDSVGTTTVFNFNFDEEDRGVWDVGLHRDVAYDLNLDGGSGQLTLDLSELSITDFEFDQGSGSTELSLPERSSFSGKIDGGSGRLHIQLPDDVGLRVELDDGSGAFRTDARFVLVSGDPDNDSIWETEDYDNADYQIDLEIDQGSGSIVIEE